MTRYIIPIISSFLPIWYAYLVPILALSFVAWVGCYIHSLFRR